MDILRTKIMTEPNAWWQPIFSWLANNTIIFMCFALVWKGIDKVFKYFSDARDIELRKIVHDEMNPSITQLSEKIEKLGEAVWALKNKV